MKYSEIEEPLEGYGIPTDLKPSLLRKAPLELQDEKSETDISIVDEECQLFVADPELLEQELREILQKNRMALEMDGDGEYPIANFIVDVFCLHNKPNENPVIPNNEILTQQRIRSGVQSLHLAMRNQGHQYHEDGVDTRINIGMGNIHYVNGHDLWGDDWDYGVRYGSSQGVSISTIMRDCKELAGTYQDPTRYAVFLYPKLSGSGTIAGFAYVGVNATNLLAGQFVRTVYWGDPHEDLVYEGEEPFSMSPLAGNNKVGSHEFGHSLALFHTFNNTNSCDEVSGPLQGDRVTDTRVHMRSNTCGWSLNENPRNNHMSYSGAVFRVVFTPGQKERMRLCVANSYPETLNNPVYDWENQTTPEIPGCTDPDALNYNPNATVDDGSCEYTPVIMPEIKAFIQTGKGEIAEFTFEVENADSVMLVATNENGSVSETKDVEFDSTPPPPPPKKFDIMVSEFPQMSPAIPISGEQLVANKSYYIYLKTNEDGQVKFYTNGQLSQTENVRPYTYNGDGGGLANPVQFSPGSYELTVTQNGNEVVSNFSVS